MKSISSLAVLGLVCAPLTPLAVQGAPENRLFAEKFFIEAGAFWPTREFSLSVEGSLGPGTQVDVQQDLDVKKRDSTSALEMGWRFKDRRTLAAGVTWAPFEHAGVTLNYNYFELNVGIEDSGWRGNVNITYHGPYLSLRALW